MGTRLPQSIVDLNQLLSLLQFICQIKYVNKNRLIKNDGFCFSQKEDYVVSFL